MAPTDQKTEVVSPAEVPEDLPLPSDPKVIFLGGLFVLALLAAAYIASEIILPFVFAIVLKLLLQPAFRILERLHVPRIIAALLLILALFGTVVGLGTAIDTPDTRYRMSPRAFPEHLSQIEYGHDDDIVRKVDPNGKVSFKGRSLSHWKSLLRPVRRIAANRRGRSPRRSLLCPADRHDQFGYRGTKPVDLWTTRRGVAHRVHRTTAAASLKIGWNSR